MAETVCVTGASGFLGSHIVAALLENGCHVIAMVRDPRTQGSARLQDFALSVGGTLQLKTADLLTPGSYDQVFSQSRYVIHTAANVTDNARPGTAKYLQVLRVNIQGAENVLASMEKSPHIEKVVLTSSMSAVLRNDKDPSYQFTESDWNTDPLDMSDPYWFSKTEAERLFCQRFIDFRRRCGAKLVSINPSVIIGPALSQQHTRTSVRIIKDLYEGATPGCPNLYFSFVDARDVALVHVRALLDGTIEGRFIMPGRSTSMVNLSRIIKEAFPTSKAPQRRIPDWLMYLSLPFNRQLSSRYLKNYLGIELKFDDSKIRSHFNLADRSLESSVIDTVRSLNVLHQLNDAEGQLAG